MLPELQQERVEQLLRKSVTGELGRNIPKHTHQNSSLRRKMAEGVEKELEEGRGERGGKRRRKKREEERRRERRRGGEESGRREEGKREGKRKRRKNKEN